MPRIPSQAFALPLLFLLLAAAGAVPAADAAPVGPSPTGIYLVDFPEPPLARYRGGVTGLEATNPQIRGEVRLDPRAPRSLAYLDHLDQQQTLHLDQVTAALGREPEVLFRYRAARNGVAVRISQAEAQRLTSVPGVVAVTPDVIVERHTDAGPSWIGAPTVWDGSSTGGLGATQGEGVIVGVIDGGTNYDHPSFGETGDDGHTHVNPLPGFLGWCDPGNPDFDPSLPCNGKLIGLWDYADAAFGEADGPNDDTGHGSHVASTAVGNVLDFPAVSGVAPHAHLVGYDIASGGTGSLATICAASDQAILDGVHVLNNSFSMGGISPWSGGATDRCFLDAVAAGIFVAVSAGNAGPGASTVDHSGPWVTTVGSSTHHRVTHENGVINMSGGSSPPADVTGDSRTVDPLGPAPVVYAGDFSNGDADPEQCLNPFPPGTWTSGEIVVCDRGSIARVLKCQNVADGGAAGCILANVAGSGDPVADAHLIPASHVDLAEGDAIRSWLASGSGHMAELTASSIVLDPAAGDVMSGFSSRGPVSPGLSNDVIKPDVTNPGDTIFAAANDDFIAGFTGLEFQFLSGTSMSSPHTAGSAALVAALHPGWSAPEIKSALMMTAKVDGVFDTGGVTPADPFDMGAGRVDLTRAARAGLVLDETDANFLAADPAMGGEPRELNIASYQNSACTGGCTFERTFRSTSASPVTWTIGDDSPAGVFVNALPSLPTIAGGATQTVTFLVDFDATATTGSFVHPEIELVPSDGSPTLHLPVAVLLGGTPSAIFTDGFESGDVSAWSSSTP